MQTEKIIAITGKIERAVDEVDRALASGRGPIVLDCRAVTFITVDGLEWLEELLMRSASSGIQVRFINLSPEVYKVFKVAHIESLLHACGAPVASGPVC